MDHMPALRDIPRGIRILGAHCVRRAVQYAIFRYLVDRRYRSRGIERSITEPGRLQGMEPQPVGARLQFAEKELVVSYLLEDLVRLHWGPAPEPVPYAIARREWPKVQTRVAQAGDGWSISSPSLEVRVGVEGGVTLLNAQGALICAMDPPLFQGDRPSQVSPLSHDECIYGLGERAADLNLRGRTYRMWNRDPGGSYGPNKDPLYLCIPAYLGLHDRGGYMIFYENSYDGSFSFHDRARCAFRGSPLRYYLTAGTVESCLNRFSLLTGRAPMPPRWALGYHQSRWGYRDEGQIRDIVAGFQARDLPLSAVHLDLDYMLGCRIFTVDPDRFPDLPRLAHDLELDEIHLVAIVDPGVKQEPGFDLFDHGMQQAVFATLPDRIPVAAPVWPGWCVFPDFTDPQARSWWGSQYPWLLDQGVRGVWHDMNEPSAFSAWGEGTLPLATQHDLDGRSGDHREAHNLYASQMNRAGFEALREAAPGARPFLLSRSGWAGVQRNAWVWTADTESSWEGLRQSLPTLLGLGLSGIPFCGTDTGGFVGHPSDELFVRWFQLAAFTPFFRTHCSLDSPPREPWRFSERSLQILKAFLHLRYQLLPYLYTCAWEASQTGAPIMRPLFWVDPRAAYREIQDCFLLGDALLVAPVLHRGERQRHVRLPPGDWYDFWEGAPFSGEADVHLPAPLERIPLLVRAGTVLPMEERGVLRLHLFPPSRGAQQSVLFSDAGDGYGEERLDRFDFEMDPEGLLLRWDSSGDYPFPYRAVELALHGVDAEFAIVDGERRLITEGLLGAESPFTELRLPLP
jgi:alpha-glucosidase